MSEQKHIEKCAHCNSERFGPFCSNCGQPQKLKKINGPYILSELASILNFQKGILFTTRELLIRPGITVRKFIHEDRNRLVKPISFIILCSLIYIITQQWLHFQDGYMDFSGLDWGNSTVTIIMEWISKNYGLANIFMAFFIAIWTKVFFKKYDYNIFEILILLYFVLGIQMLMFSVLGIVESISKLSVLDNFSIIALAYVWWAIGRFFDPGKKINYLKGLFSYILGLVSFIFLAVVCGVLVDWMIR